MSTTPIVPPATLGMIGGGQLGRYFVMAARTMGYRTIVLEPDSHAPAGVVADVHLVAPYDDPASLEHLGRECAVVSTEFENASAEALAHLANTTLVRPSSGAVAIAQDRRAEKAFLRSIGLDVAPYAVVESADDVVQAASRVSFPAILKTARLGYDGLGQVPVATSADLAPAWDRLGAVPCVLEQRLSFDREVSVVAARGPDGSFAAYPLATNAHANGILDVTVVSSAEAESIGAVATAHEMARAIANALDYVGVFAVEMFVVDGAFLINEIAPRPHNSGHWTLDFAATSQFEQQVRAVCGLPLGATTLLANAAAMANLLGDLWEHGEPNWSAGAHPDAHLHLYGKRAARPGRKMGHLSASGSSADAAASLAAALRSAL